MVVTLLSPRPSVLLEYHQCSGRAELANYSTGTTKEHTAFVGTAASVWCGTTCYFWNWAVNFCKVKLTSVSVSIYWFCCFILTFSVNSKGQYVGAVSFNAELLVMTARKYYKFYSLIKRQLNIPCEDHEEIQMISQSTHIKSSVLHTGIWKFICW